MLLTENASSENYSLLNWILAVATMFFCTFFACLPVIMASHLRGIKHEYHKLYSHRSFSTDKKVVWCCTAVSRRPCKVQKVNNGRETIFWIRFDNRLDEMITAYSLKVHLKSFSSTVWVTCAHSNGSNWPCL